MLQWSWMCKYQFEIVILFPLDMYPEVGIAGSYDSYIFNFLRNLHTVFHNCCSNLHTHQQCTRVFFSLFANTYLLTFGDSHTNRCEVVSHCGFDLQISLIISDVKHLSYTCWPFVCLLCKNCYSDPLPIFKLTSLVLFCFVCVVFCFLFFVCSWVIWVPYIFWILAPDQTYALKTLSPIPWVPPSFC